MSRTNWNYCRVLVVALSCSTLVCVTSGQDPMADVNSVVIRREPLRLIAPEAFRLPLQLEATKQLIIAAPCDGTVQSVDAESGKSVKAQESLVRMETTERQLLLDRAIALSKVAELELEQAKKGGQGGIELAEARVKAAQAEVKLLQWQLEQLNARAAFNGTVLKLHVQPGQFVKAGEPLVTLADLAQLKVDLPVDRDSVKEGDTFKLRVENRTVEAKIAKLSPADVRFEKVRDIATSLATATIVLDNANHTWHVGQAVFAPLVPRHPVAELMNSAVGTTEKGTRRVQVVRQGVVRDIEVDPLGQVGAERIFVSGPLIEGDAAVLSSSRELTDGTQVRPNPGAALPARPVVATPSTITNSSKSDKPATPEKKKSASGF